MNNDNFDLLTVHNSKVLFRADGRASLLLQGQRNSKETYSIAFEVRIEGIQILQKQLAKIEQFLSHQQGRA